MSMASSHRRNIARLSVRCHLAQVSSGISNDGISSVLHDCAVGLAGVLFELTSVRLYDLHNGLIRFYSHGKVSRLGDVGPAYTPGRPPCDQAGKYKLKTDYEGFTLLRQ